MTKSDVLILGAGYVGTEFAREAIQKDWRVICTTRSSQKIEALKDLGVEAVDWDIQGSSMGELIDEIDQFGQTNWRVLYSIPTIYRQYQESEDEEALPRHVKPVSKVLDFFEEKQNLDQFVYLSSTSVYGDHGGDWVDEASECRPRAPVGQMRRDIEEFVLNLGLNTSVARLSGIYGPGRTMMSLIESGRYRLVDGGTKPTNRIHLHDIVRGIFKLFEQKPEGFDLFNFSDGNPKTSRELAEFLAEKAGVPVPDEISLEEYAKERGPNSVARWRDTYRVSNERLRQILGLDLKYEDVFEGYSKLLS